MRVLLISANTEAINMVPMPLGLNCVAVATRAAGHEVELLDLMGAKDSGPVIRAAVERLQPQVIGVSVRNIDDQNMEESRLLLPPVRDVIACCRSASTAPIVLGGAGYSMYPEAALQYLQADLGIHGEGEVAFPALLDRIQRGADLSGVPGLYAPDIGAKNRCRNDAPLDTLPLPDPALWPATSRTDPEIWVPFQARRGCPMNCSYCSTAAVEGTTIRTRLPEAVVHGIAQQVEAGFDHFYFVDNVFNIPPSYAKALCAALKDAGLGIRWRCILYPGQIDEELVQGMAEAGCVEASLGFESGCEQILRNLNKKFKPSAVVAASEMLARHGIRRFGFMLLGGPGETRETVIESLAFADSLKLDLLRLTAGIRIYPDTALANTAEQVGFISPEDDLLTPRFYLARGLEGWLGPTVREWMADRPHWVT